MNDSSFKYFELQIDIWFTETRASHDHRLLIAFHNILPKNLRSENRTKLDRGKCKVERKEESIDIRKSKEKTREPG